MIILSAIVLLLLISFIAVVAVGAPFVPTRRQDVAKAIALAQLPSGGTIIDLGSGDGRLLKAAAEQGINAIGYELNPFLVILSKWRCRKYSHLVTVKMTNFWQTKLPPQTDAVFVFLAKPFMNRLAHFLRVAAQRNRKSILLISYGFELPEKEPIRQDKALLCYKIQP